MTTDVTALLDSATAKCLQLQRELGQAETCNAELLAALRRLSAAALARDATMGDPCRLAEVRAELHAANMHAVSVIANAAPTA